MAPPVSRMTVADFECIGVKGSETQLRERMAKASVISITTAFSTITSTITTMRGTGPPKQERSVILEPKESRLVGRPVGRLVGDLVG